MVDAKRGGARPGAGRPKGETTTMVRVPDGCLEQVRQLISVYRNGGELPSLPAQQAGDAHKQVDLPLAPLDSELSHTQIDGWHPITELPEPGRRIDVWSVQDGCGNCVYDLGATHYIADSISSANWVKRVAAWRYTTPVLAPFFPRF
ncbi:hypothetical protein [Aeromonas caviae]|uniref:hypothetical protein n=1 Tax=Aeromonas caviae TaxID=648 RepID=UPI002B46088F|nr:hypothetical protein [Aeromonas caviae]